LRIRKFLLKISERVNLAAEMRGARFWQLSWRQVVEMMKNAKGERGRVVYGGGGGGSSGVGDDGGCTPSGMIISPV
jgi:hypothetical protein